MRCAHSASAAAAPTSSPAGCSALLRVRGFSGDLDAATKAADLALKAARKSRRRPLAALALSRLAATQMSLRQSAAAVRNANAAAQQFDSLGNELERGRALWVVACAQDDLGHKKESERAADLALALARRSGDRWGEASALNIRWRQNIDLALRLRGLQQALAGYRASGHVSGQAAIYNNLALAYRALGLYRRANRMAQRSTEIRRRLQAFNFVVNGLMILGGNEVLAGNPGAARKHLAELEAAGSLPGGKDGGIWAMDMDWLPGLIAIAERDGVAALPPLEKGTGPGAVTAGDELRDPRHDRPVSSASPARPDSCGTRCSRRGHGALRRAGEPCVGRAACLRRTCGGGITARWRQRAKRGKPPRRWKPPTTLLQEGIGTSERRRPAPQLPQQDRVAPRHRPCLDRACAPGAGCPRGDGPRTSSGKRTCARRSSASSTPALRLNELRSADELHEFLIDEATELSGAERVLLVLETPEGLRLAGSLVPRGEDAQALLAE